MTAGERAVREVGLVVIRFAAEACAADVRKLDLAERLAIELADLDLGVGVADEVEHEVAADDSDGCDRGVALGHDLFPLVAVGFLGVDLVHAVLRRAIVGHDVELVLPHVDAVFGIATVGDWRSLADNANGQALNLGIPFTLAASSTTLYAVIVSRGTPTYASTADLTLRVGILQD